MTRISLHILRGYGRILQGSLILLGWIATLAGLSAIITLPLWFAASRFPTAYTSVSLIVVLVGLGWLLLGGRRPGGATIFWVADIVLILLGLALGWYVVMAVALVGATGVIAHRLA